MEILNVYAQKTTKLAPWGVKNGLFGSRNTNSLEMLQKPLKQLMPGCNLLSQSRVADDTPDNNRQNRIFAILTRCLWH